MTGQLNGKFTKNAMYLSLPLLTALKAVLYTLCKKKNDPICFISGLFNESCSKDFYDFQGFLSSHRLNKITFIQ